MHKLAANDPATPGIMMIDEFFDGMPMGIPGSGRDEDIFWRDPIELRWISHMATVRRPTVMGADHHLRALTLAFVSDGAHWSIAAPNDLCIPIYIKTENSRDRVRLRHLPLQVAEDGFEVGMNGINRQFFAPLVPSIDPQ